MTTAQPLDTHHPRGEQAAQRPSVEPWAALTNLLAWLLSLFAANAHVFKTARRQRRHPANWREHLPQLRDLEWSFACVMRKGVARALRNEPLDLTSIPCGETPDDFVCTIPRSADAMALRLETINRVLAHPERYICRLAARLQRETADPLRLDAARRSTSPAFAVEANFPSRFSSGACGLAAPTHVGEVAAAFLRGSRRGSLVRAPP